MTNEDPTKPVSREGEGGELSEETIDALLRRSAEGAEELDAKLRRLFEPSEGKAPLRRR